MLARAVLPAVVAAVSGIVCAAHAADRSPAALVAVMEQEHDVSTIASSDAVYYTVQVGAFRRRLSALRLLRRLVADFPDSRIIVLSTERDRLFRVVSGGFATESKAREYSRRLAGLGFHVYLRRAIRITESFDDDSEDVELEAAPAKDLIEIFGSSGAEDRAARAAGGSESDDLPQEGHTWMINGRPLTLGAKYTLKPRRRSNFSIGLRDDGEVRVSQRLDLNVLYRATERTSMFVETRILHNAQLAAEDRTTESSGNIQRGDSWIYFDDSSGSGFGLQIGRQRFRDKREWWWDESLDAIRIHYSWRDRFSAQLALGQRLARISFDDAQIDPEKEDVARILGHLSWRASPKLRLEAFYLKQDDHSSTQTDGQLIAADDEDEIDADLTWFGLRAMGKWKVNSDHRLYYWLDTARVTGKELVTDFDPSPVPGMIVADNPFVRDVSGWGLDAGVTWNTRWPLEPSFTLGYAYGSGDSDPKRDSKGTDRAFRQTDLQDNNGKFRGVDRFRYYGEVSRPELSNLHIGTVALGFPLLESSSLEILWHLYRQVHAAKFLRDARIRKGGLAQRRDIGQEIDLLVGLEEWDRLEFEIVAGLFRAGDAYGAESGEVASNVVVKVTYEF